MSNLKRHAILAGIITAIVLAMWLYIALLQKQRDYAKQQLAYANSQIIQLQQANQTLNLSIELLEKQNQQYLIYMADLEERKKQSEQQALLAIQNFNQTKQQYNNVNTWANQALPKELIQNE